MWNPKVACLLVLQMTRSNCEMRKTIKVEKYPFPTGWEPAATYMIEGDDQKEVSAFFEDRCVSEKWGGVVGQW